MTKCFNATFPPRVMSHVLVAQLPRAVTIQLLSNWSTRTEESSTSAKDGTAVDKNIMVGCARLPSTQYAAGASQQDATVAGSMQPSSF